MAPRGGPKVVLWDQKVIPSKTSLHLVLDPPMVREVFPKKLKTGFPFLLKTAGF